MEDALYYYNTILFVGAVSKANKEGVVSCWLVSERF